MLKSRSILLLITLFTACTAKKPADDFPVDREEPQGHSAVSPVSTELFLGSYVGSFGNNKISVFISKFQNDTLEGRSIVAGNDRLFSGSYRKEGSLFRGEAKEPGDHVHDGIFHFTFDQKNADRLGGTWEPLNAALEHKAFTLERRAFQYRTDVGVYPEASQRILKPSDVENLRKSDLEIMRNEIFARHGYCFRKKDLRYYFELNDWYVPARVTIVDELSDIERKNIQLIKHYEKYAEEFSDEFGR